MLTVPGDGNGILLTNAVGQPWLSFEQLRAIRPDVIVVHITGRSDGKPAVDYTLKATAEPGGVKLTVVLDRPLPPDLVGKAGFNLEFIPDRYRTKTFQTDTNGDGRYDDFGVIPLLPFDDMELKERARTDDEAWYVKEWNRDRGDYQPVPLTSGRTITLAPEDPQNRVRITSDSGDLHLLDGRNRAQNGWFVVRTLFQPGSTQLVWHIKADVDRNWTRQPQARNWSPDISLNARTAMFARNSPHGAPNCGQEAINPRLLLVRAHSIASNTEPPHSPPTPTPWMKRRRIMMTAPQTPICS